MNHNRPWRGQLTWLVVLLCVLASVGAWQATLDAEESNLATHFRNHALQRVLTIEHGINDDLGAVEALAALEARSEEVTPEEFRVVAGGLLMKHRSLVGLSWNVRVPQSERARIEAECTAGVSPPCRITERGMAGKLVPARPREHYTVVRLIEPLVENEAALGYDVGSEPRRLAALTRASESGNLSVTAPIHLVQDDGSRTGLLAFHPVYRKGAPVRTREERLRGIAGFVVGVFDSAALVEHAFDRLELDSMDFWVYDTEAPHGAAPLYSSQTPGSGEGARFVSPRRRDVASFASEATLRVADRSWRTRFVPTPAALAEHRTAFPAAVLVLGLLLSTGVGTHLWRLSAANEELARQIVQRERAEAATRRSEERWKLTLDASTDGGWDWNILTGEIYFSDAWLDSLGYSRDDAVPQIEFWREITHPDDRVIVERAVLEHLAGRTARYECVSRLRKKTGEYRWNLDRGAVVERDSEGRPLRMVGIDTDITERVEAEEEHRRLDVKLQHAQKLESLGVLAGGIAHDFNNLLVGMLGNADLALGKCGAGGCDAELEQIRLAATRAAELTRQMLAYAGKAQFARERLDVSHLVGEMLELIEASISKNVAIRYDPAASPATVEGDGTQIRQVAMNLILNAAEAVGANDGTVCVRTTTRNVDRAYLDAAELDRTDGPGRFVCLEVGDSGCGMDDEQRSRIFDPFFTTKFHGRGLGLAAVLGIVTAHRGAIRVESEPGRGTRFSVLFPLAESPSRPTTAPSRSVDRPRNESGTVLVVDDEPAVRLVAARALENAGFEVLTADDGDQALERARAHAAELRAVLLDLTMPGRSAVETFRGLRSLCDAPIVLSSGYAAEQCLSEFGEAPAGFLQKPYRTGALVDAMRGAIVG